MVIEITVVSLLTPIYRPRNGEHVWTAPYWQEDFGVLISVGCRHVSGLLMRPFIAAGPDVFRRLDPRHVIALFLRQLPTTGFSNLGIDRIHHTISTSPIR
ncbi:hypothetical protein [Asticcacaulis excentricus]|uniref:hypothetical protein n=1 Tax=Asticcacaulis excentricus TaxID=78587 RepID=UPI000F82B99F|nr:hypothetical protein [Asticcacaulis excentricus]